MNETDKNDDKLHDTMVKKSEECSTWNIPRFKKYISAACKTYHCKRRGHIVGEEVRVHTSHISSNVTRVILSEFSAAFLHSSVNPDLENRNRYCFSNFTRLLRFMSLFRTS